MRDTTPSTTLEFSGSLDVRRTAEVRAAIYDRLASTEGDLNVDLSHVESLDIITLKMLAVANRFAERQGRRVVLRGCAPGVRRLMHLSHLRPMLPVEPDSSAEAV